MHIQIIKQIEQQIVLFKQFQRLCVNFGEHRSKFRIETFQPKVNRSPSNMLDLPGNWLDADYRCGNDGSNLAKHSD